MRHQSRGNKSTRTEAALLEHKSMLDWNQNVTLSVEYESRARYLMHLAQIIELLGQEVRKESNFV